jgi:tetratricopeptide (TPR) repeat protein
VTAEEKVSMQASFAQVQTAIAANVQDFNSWIELGDLRKEAGDYAGAEADWQYISALYPSNIVSNANLADLYTFYLHKYPQAAAAYKAAIANDPKQVALYVNLFSLYTNQYPQPSATIVALLKQGLAVNPNAAELKADLAKYQ